MKVSARSRHFYITTKKDSPFSAASLRAAALAVARQRRAQGDARRATRATTSLARISAVARARGRGGIVAGRSGGSVIVGGHGGCDEDGVGGSWACETADGLGEACGSARRRRRVTEGFVCFV